MKFKEVKEEKRGSKNYLTKGAFGKNKIKTIKKEAEGGLR